MKTPDDGGEPVSLYYAKSELDGEWYCLRALASNRCKTNLRTSGWAAMAEHPLPSDGFQDDWEYAMFVGKFYTDESGWGGEYRGSWFPWGGR